MQCDHTIFATADDAQRMLLCCVLRDAMEWHYTIAEGCDACQAANAGVCMGHWDTHYTAVDTYISVRDHLGRFEGLPYGRVCPLSAAQQRTLTSAVAEAITYRVEMRQGADAELLAAYRLLKARPVGLGRARAGQGRPPGRARGRRAPGGPRWRTNRAA